MIKFQMLILMLFLKQVILYKKVDKKLKKKMLNIEKTCKMLEKHVKRNKNMLNCNKTR